MTSEGIPASLGQVKLPGREQSSAVKGRRGKALAGRRGRTRIICGFAAMHVYFPPLKGIRSFGTEGPTVGLIEGEGQDQERMAGRKYLEGRMRWSTGEQGLLRGPPCSLYPTERWNWAVAQAA